jgi:hypothetical protein
MVRCTACLRLLPSRAGLPVVDFAGRVLKVCGATCKKEFAARYAAVIQATSAPRASALRQAFASGGVSSAGHTTAAGAYAGGRTKYDAPRTDRTGRRGHMTVRGPRVKARVAYCVNNAPQGAACPVACCPCCDGLGVAARCEACAGMGAVITRSQREADLAHSPRAEKCTVCNGHGYFPLTEDLLAQLGFRKEPQSWPQSSN